MTDMNHKITRRKFLKYTAAGLAAAGVGTVLQACSKATPPAATTAPTVMAAATSAPKASFPGRKLSWHWWGEQEAPGLEAWNKKILAKYKAQAGVDVETTLLDSSVVVTDIQTASAANSAADLYYMWNGIYHMESVWLGYVQPLDDLLPAELIKASNATKLSVYQGKTYRLGWYGGSPLYLYNKDQFDKAGLNADVPPKNWDELMNACDKLKAKGFTPICGGLKDGPWGEWYMGHGLTQNLDSAADALNLFNGTLDWREPKYWEHWDKLAQLWKAGYLNDDMNSVDLYPGIDNFGAGKGAMTAVVVSFIDKVQNAIGKGKVGAMVFPFGGKGKMAGKPIVDTQGNSIALQSKNQDVAADLLKFMNEPEQLSSLYTDVKALPVNTNWDGKEIDDPYIKNIWQNWIKNPDAVPYISNLMPTLFWTDAMFVNSQNIISGKFTGEQAGQNAYDVTQKWTQQNPDLVDKYKKWAADLSV